MTDHNKRVSLPAQPVPEPAQSEETQARLDAMIERVHTFADQLLAWGHEDAAAQVRREILEGPVQTDQAYQSLLATRAALARRVSEREQLRSIIASALAGRWDATAARRALEET